MATTLLKKIKGFGTEINIQKAAGTAVIHSEDTIVFPPMLATSMAATSLQYKNGVVTVSIRQDLVQGTDFKYRDDGKGNWEIEFTQPESVSYPDTE